MEEQGEEEGAGQQRCFSPYRPRERLGKRTSSFSPCIKLQFFSTLSCDDPERVSTTVEEHGESRNAPGPP